MLNGNTESVIQDSLCVRSLFCVWRLAGSNCSSKAALFGSHCRLAAASAESGMALKFRKNMIFSQSEKRLLAFSEPHAAAALAFWQEALAI